MQNERSTAVRAAVLLLLLVGSLLVYLPEHGSAVFGLYANVLHSAHVCEEGRLCISYLDIGQGDATFIESPTGTQVLIDGGPDSSVLRGLGDIMHSFDHDIDIVIPTHPDADHVTGLIDVLDRYNVSTVVRTENESSTSMWQTLEEKIKAEGADIIYARRGQIYDLGGGAKLEMLFPDRDVSGLESNTSSIVARLTYGTNAFIFTGDSPKAIEEYLVLTEGEHLKSDVLKVGHHGSRTSTSEVFLAEVDPDYAIISSGKDNPYGHPHVEVTDLLFNYGIETKNTADEGSIYLVSDGETVTFIE